MTYFEDAFAAFLLRTYGTKPDEYEPTTSKGYWRRKTACGGRGKCRAPLHGFWRNEGPIHHTIYFQDPTDRDEQGRFVARFKTWESARANREPAA